MTRNGWILTGVIALLLVGIAAWWFATFERVERTITLPPRGEARYNPYFALKEALKSRDIPVRSGATLVPTRLKPGDVLLLGMDVRSLSPENSAALLGFVEGGGHLLFVVPEDSERLGTLPETFDLQAGSPRFACTGWAANAEAGIRVGRWCSAHRFDRGRVPADKVDDSGERFRDSDGVLLRGLPKIPDADAEPAPDAERIDNRHRADPDSADSAATDAEQASTGADILLAGLPHDVDGYLTLTATYGAGTWTALVSTEPFTNRNLGYEGNAELVWQLLGPLIGEGSTVELVYGSDIPPWYVLLFYQGWPVWIPLLIALLAWLWRRAQRFGPLLPALPPPRRALLDHVRASGEFLYRQGRTQTLLDALRRRFRRTLERRDPALAALSPRELIPTLAERERLSEDTLREALLPPFTPPPRHTPRERLAASLILLWRLSQRR